jgi:hydroxyacylglutathione hydrolase
MHVLPTAGAANARASESDRRGDAMIVDRIFTPGLAQVAYLVADDAAGVVAVIDPRRDVEVYEAWAAARGLRISAILETHVHADFVSGAPELARRTGAPVYAGRLGASEFPHVAVDDGDEVAVGALILRALWTPGHTPEHIAWLLVDPAVRPEPLALFSGDVLFVGEVGRPDLLGATHTDDLVEQLYVTISQRLAPLLDDVVVYPGHTAGSACGKKIGDAPQTTMGAERRTNYAFAATDRADFVAKVMVGMPTPPAYYPVMKRVNKVGATPVATLADGVAMSPAEVEAAQAAGARVLDVRMPEAFAGGHIRAAINVGLRSDFMAWVGWIATYDQDIVVVAESAEDAATVRHELRRIGLDRFAGWLDGGMPAWIASGRPVAKLLTVDVDEVARGLETRIHDCVLVDVRSEGEVAAGHAPGMASPASVVLRTGELPVGEAGRIGIICGSGYRSSVVASLLLAQGEERVVNVRGGMAAWLNAGLPAVTASEPARS